MEDQTIIRTVSDLFKGADERDWTKVRDAMAEKVLLDYSSLSGSPPATMPASQIVEAWKGFLPGFDKTHHQLSDFKTGINGSNASLTFNGKADHFIGKEVWSVEGAYRAELTPVNEMWLVTMLTFSLTRQSGNTSLPGIATENAGKGRPGDQGCPG